jgi:hypothetical protein
MEGLLAIRERTYRQGQLLTHSENPTASRILTKAD